MRRLLLAATIVAASGLTASSGHASLLWISDSADNIGEVDTATGAVVAGSVHNTGLPLTDIAFDASSQMYGTTFTALYALNQNTGAASARGAYVGESGMNSLLGTSTGLLGASFLNTNVYSINASNAALSIFTNAPANSSGDMAIHSGVLYGLGVSGGPNTLMTLSGTGSGKQLTLHVGTAAGPTLTDAFGLADDGVTLYAVAATQIFSVDPATGILTVLSNYGGNTQGLTNVTGAAFNTEGSVVNPLASAVPEPSTLAVLFAGILGLGAWRFWRRG